MRQCGVSLPALAFANASQMAIALPVADVLASSPELDGKPDAPSTPLSVTPAPLISTTTISRLSVVLVRVASAVLR